jgi:hypothetical protein
LKGLLGGLENRALVSAGLLELRQQARKTRSLLGQTQQAAKENVRLLEQRQQT